MKDLLQPMLNLLQVYEKGTDEQLLQEQEKLKGEYFKLVKEWGEDKVIESTLAFFSDNISGQIYILSLLLRYCSTVALLMKILDLLIFNEINVWDLMIYKKQISSQFHKIKDSGYKLEIFRKRTILNQLIVSGYKKEIGIDFEYVPQQERNRTIVIVTNQLLSLKHAPTKVLFEICNSLQKLGIQPFIVVAMGTDDLKQMNKLWFGGMLWNHSEDFMGNFLIQYKNAKYTGRQLFIDKNNLSEQRNLVKQVYALKPMCIWQIGEGTAFAELFHKSITVAGMACSSEFFPMEADIILRYLRETDEETRQREDFIRSRNQTIIDFRFPCVPQEVKCSEDMVPVIEKDDFLISIVGTRLNSEVTTEFIEVLNRILDIDERISILFIGNFDEYEIKCKGILQERSQYIGRVSDLLTAVGYSKLFLNPPRRGGGAGGMRAILNGIPVITLPGCDIASAVGNEFVCNNLDEMISLVERYVHDREFYDEMCEVARRKAKEENSISLDAEMKGLVENIIATIEKTEKQDDEMNEIRE